MATLAGSSVALEMRKALPGSVFTHALAVSLACAISPAMAQAPAKRLSTWLLEQPASDESYPLGLSWRVPDEVAPQTLARVRLLNDLSGANREVTADKAAMARLRDLIGSMPATGRVAVALADARWLEANPERDPVLLAGHTVVLPPRPRTVTVVTDTGELCQVIHASGREALSYLETCNPRTAGSIDRAWIAQPDGRLQRVGVASWNRQAQDEPAPGAWIWGPARNAGFPDAVSLRLITFLATQGPAPDSTIPAAAPPLQISAAAAQAEASRDPVVTSSDWGSVGLLQTPSARMRKLGSFSFTLSRTNPYTHGNVFFQPFEWMEAGFRYTNISNRLYGPQSLSGNQAYKDKSIDLKLRVLKESAYLPEIAIGLRDVAGTGLFSSEYVVANKRTGSFDWSLGMGWGYLGGRGDVRNPLGRIFSSFDRRTPDVGVGGNFGLGTYFRGPAAFFGGVQYQSPWDKLTLKLEYDGNNYQNDPLGNVLKQRTPFNFGAVYRAAPWADVSFGLERGNTLMLGIALHTQLDGMGTPKINDPKPVPVAGIRPVNSPDWASTSRDIAVQSNWQVRRIDQVGNELRVSIDDPEAVYLRDRLDKAAAVLHRDAPASVDRFALTYRQRGVEVAEHVIDRDAWVAQRTQPVPPHSWREPVMARTPGATAATPVGSHALYEKRLPRFESGLGFDFQQTLGGPDGFILYQISAIERAKLRLRDDTWLQGSLRLSLLNNYDKFKYTAPSDLPRVRTFMREYLTTSSLTMPDLQLTHVGKIGENQFYSVYGGYLESMFGGVGAEWLYKRPESRVAFGVDFNSVRQRAFEQNFAFRDYRVNTGHATLYWDTGWQDIQATVKAGRYLAGDFGATVELARTFKNGVTIGAFATKTNVSAAQFGEGSFDKGIYLSIPFDAMLTRSTNTIGNFVWKPLVRDGGAILNRTNLLYPMTRARNERALWFEPAPKPNDAVIPADRREDWVAPAQGPEPYLPISQRPPEASFTAGSNTEYALVEALHRQGFRAIEVDYDASRRLSLKVSNDEIRPTSLAVGRAARTALRLAPLEAREIRITFTERDTSLVTYEFIDLPKFERYLSGTASKEDLAPTISVRYHDSTAGERDPIALLRDVETVEYRRNATDFVPGLRTAGQAANDFYAAGRTALDVDWAKAGTLGAGLVLASGALDKRALKFAQDHAGDRWIKGFNRVGNAIPLLGAGAVAWAAFGSSDPVRSRTGITALEAGSVAFLASTGSKYLVGRARPGSGLGPASFKPFSSQDSFPSRHAAISWALAAPFATEYGTYWPYAAAAVASLARVTRREHWVSDTVAGSLLGYGIGKIFWESNREKDKRSPRALLGLSGISFAWDLD